MPGLHLQRLDGAGARGRRIGLRAARRALLAQGALQRRELPAQRLRHSEGSVCDCVLHMHACGAKPLAHAKQQEPARALPHGALCPHAPSGSQKQALGRYAGHAPAQLGCLLGRSSRRLLKPALLLQLPLRVGQLGGQRRGLVLRGGGLARAAGDLGRACARRARRLLRCRRRCLPHHMVATLRSSTKPFKHQALGHHSL